MLRFAARRLLAALPVVAAVSVLVFLFLRASGDPAAELAGEDATPERLAAIRAALELDLPVWQQFLAWLGQLLHGEFGRSLISGDTVARMVGERLEATLSLALATMLVSVLLGVGLGMLAARHRGGWLDRAVGLVCVGGFSVPSFVVGYLLELGVPKKRYSDGVYFVGLANRVEAPPPVDLVAIAEARKNELPTRPPPSAAQIALLKPISVRYTPHKPLIPPSVMAMA